jgi:hypothetical protein
MPDGTIAVFQGRAGYGGALPLATATINRAHTHVIRIGAPGLDSSSRSHRERGLSTDDETRPDDETPPPGVTVFDAKDSSGIDTDGTVDGIVNMTFPDSLQVGDYLFVVDDRTLEFQVLLLDSCNLLQECSV